MITAGGVVRAPKHRAIETYCEMQVKHAYLVSIRDKGGRFPSRCSRLYRDQMSSVSTEG